LICLQERYRTDLENAKNQEIQRFTKDHIDGSLVMEKMLVLVGAVHLEKDLMQQFNMLKVYFTQKTGNDSSKTGPLLRR